MALDIAQATSTVRTTIPPDVSFVNWRANRSKKRSGSSSAATWTTATPSRSGTSANAFDGHLAPGSSTTMQPVGGLCCGSLVVGSAIFMNLLMGAYCARTSRRLRRLFPRSLFGVKPAHQMDLRPLRPESAPSPARRPKAQLKPQTLPPNTNGSAWRRTGRVKGEHLGRVIVATASLVFWALDCESHRRRIQDASEKH